MLNENGFTVLGASFTGGTLGEDFAVGGVGIVGELLDGGLVAVDGLFNKFGAYGASFWVFLYGTLDKPEAVVGGKTVASLKIHYEGGGDSVGLGDGIV